MIPAMEPLIDALNSLDSTVIMAALLGLSALALIAALVLHHRASADIGALTGRLSQMAESQSAAQAHMAENLRQQERILTQAVETRLADLQKRMGDRLHESAQSTQSTVNQLNERLAVIDAAQKNITELSTQVVGLQDILANKQARGAFGEIQLNDIVRSILPPSAYVFQATLGTGKRADCLLNLPHPPGPIVIDAKFPLESYKALRDARDEVSAVAAGRTFGADVRRHVLAIAERYIVPGETAESALMFLPSEAVYAELHANFRAVVEESYRARVWIVSPTTLMATLNTVRAVLKDVRLREQANVIQSQLRHIVEDVGRLDDRVEKLQRHFDQAAEDVRMIRTSTEKVVKRAERLEDLDFDEKPEPAELAGSPEPLRMERS
jgi:DNA recombination protein RmuC